MSKHHLVHAALNTPVARVRNFMITAHVDHGKSTLSDRVLELTGNLTKHETRHGQVLDKLRVERERGITVKAQSATMLWKDHLLNLVDTPGHVDFNFEVRRSITSCEGSVLLVDATQGIQAQTLANYSLVRAAKLEVVCALTKLDLKTSDPESSLKQIESLLGIKESEVIWTSSKTGEGVDTLLDAIVQRIPPPRSAIPESPEDGLSPLAQVVDLSYDQYRGVLALVVVRRGSLASGERLCLVDPTTGMAMEGAAAFEVKEVGILTPKTVPMTGVEGLKTGRVGYILSVNSKGLKEAFVGCFLGRYEDVTGGKGVPWLDSLSSSASSSSSSAIGRPTPTVFASCYPIDADDFDDLKKALQRLSLNDASVSMKQESSTALGTGFRMGFLGFLHVEVFTQRLRDEFGTEMIITAPSVTYRVEMTDGKTLEASTPSNFPTDRSKIRRVFEPMVMVNVITPIEYVGPIMEILSRRRGTQIRVDNSVGDVGNRAMLTYKLPWAEAISDLQDEIKSVSSGYASFDLEETEAEPADVVRVDILLNGIPAEPLAFICHRSSAESRGRAVARRLKDVVPQQQFDCAIQAAVGSKIVARESIKGVRKNVLEKSGKTVGGGDVTRKMKLLEAQKRGKERLKRVGRVTLNQDAFFAVLGTSSSSNEGGGRG